MNLRRARTLLSSEIYAYKQGNIETADIMFDDVVAVAASKRRPR